MSTAIHWTERDLLQVRHLLRELLAAGRRDEAETLARVHALIHDALDGGALAEDEADQAFALEFDQAIAELDAGEGIAHNTVAHELGLTPHGRA